MGLAELKADAKLAREALIGATTLDEIKLQLLENILPLFEGMADATTDELVKLDEVMETLVVDVDNLMNDAGDQLHPETAAKLVGVIELGKILGRELAMLAKGADEMTRKRLAPLLKQYAQGAEVAIEMIAEMTFTEEDDEPTTVPGAPAPLDDDGKDDEDDDDDEEDDDDDDLDEVEA